jgi:hypothetical protein
MQLINTFMCEESIANLTVVQHYSPSPSLEETKMGESVGMRPRLSPR